MAEPTEQSARKLRLLYMDDERGLREVMRRIVPMLGHHIDMACTGDEMIALFKQAENEGTPYDILLLDLSMPGGKGGRELIPQIRSMRPQIFAVAVSGYSQDPVIANPEEFGFDASMAKPFTVESMEAVFARAEKVIDRQADRA